MHYGLPKRQLRLRLRLNTIHEAEHATVARPQALANRLRQIGSTLQARYQA